MIPKSGKTKTDPPNKPISLLDTKVKLFEILILKRLKSYVSPSIQPKQYAFRPEHSKTIQLIKLVDDLVINFNRKVRTSAIFLDFEKAFVKVCHQGILYKLLTLNLPVQLINMIKVQTYLLNLHHLTGILKPESHKAPAYPHYYSVYI